MVRDGAAGDAIHDVVPRFVAEPATPEGVAETLAWAARDQLLVFTRGAGTKLDWGPSPRAIDVLISTTRLNSVIAHRHGDLTATVQSGATLAEVNRTLAKHRQWIPLDPPSADKATIGGLVATNDSGPRRHRYGAPRDLIIGIEFARADGCLAKGGGIVVKNVAGYDLPRLITGSFGSLAVIVSATFKLYPLASASRTLAVDLKHPRDLGALTAKILGSHLTPTALEFHTPPLGLLLRFESIEAAVEQQVIHATKLIADSGFHAKTIAGAEEDVVWGRHGSAVWNDGGPVIKVSTLPAELAGTLELIDRLSGASGYAAAGRAGLGVFLLRIGGDVEEQMRVIDGLRSALPAGRGSAVVTRGSPELKAQVDVWGPIGDGLSLMHAVKRQFDPAGILNPGRGPGGI